MSAASRSHSLFARTPVNGASFEPGALFMAAAILTTLSIAACGSSSSTPKADAGAGTGGAGTAGATGTGTGGRDAGVTTGTGGKVAGPDAAVGGTTGSVGDSIGQNCTSDRDCTSPLSCLKPDGKDIGGSGGPAGGYCTFKCSDMADAKCTALSGACVDLGTTTTAALYCLQTCTLGSDPNQKCRNRTDVACFPTTADATATAGACLPTCSSDVECPTGKSCLYSICVDAASAATVTGDPLGSHCDASKVNTPMDTCKEQCFGTVGTPPAFCTKYCVVNSLTACSFVEKMTPLTGEHGLCLAVVTASTTGAADPTGDVGICVQQCDAVADCLDAKADTGWTCDTTTAPALGHGFCSFM